MSKTIAVAEPGFAARVLEWARREGRHDLPWQHPRNAYRVWVSEIMLQQTQVERVRVYFQRFMTRFPALADLAAAEPDEVMPYWAGLGYYARARNLHKAARQIADSGAAMPPQSITDLLALPGIGRSTAGAIRSLGHQLRGVILDGNVKRVLCRYAGLRDWPGETATLKQLWQLAERLTPQQESSAYNQAMMDLGATLCTRRKPDCMRCPLRADCIARADGLTSVIPAPKPRRQRPIRHRFVLLARTGAAVLLQRRPQSGIWGGLWSLPETDVDIESSAAMDAFASLLRCDKADLAITTETISHDFTHFRLIMTPVLCLPAARVNQSVVSEVLDMMWHEEGSIDELALPSPILRLLQAWLRADSEASDVGQYSLRFA